MLYCVGYALGAGVEGLRRDMLCPIRPRVAPIPPPAAVSHKIPFFRLHYVRGTDTTPIGLSCMSAPLEENRGDMQHLCPWGSGRPHIRCAARGASLACLGCLVSRRDSSELADQIPYQCLGGIEGLHSSHCVALHGLRLQRCHGVVNLRRLECRHSAL